MDPPGWRLDSDAFIIIVELWWRTYLVPMFLLLLFFFSDLRLVCVALTFVVALLSTLPRMRLMLRALTGCNIDARGQAPRPMGPQKMKESAEKIQLIQD